MKKYILFVILLCLSILLIGCHKTEKTFVADHMASAFYESFHHEDVNVNLEDVVFDNVEYTYTTSSRIEETCSDGSIYIFSTVLNILFEYHMNDTSYELFVRYTDGMYGETPFVSVDIISDDKTIYETYVSKLTLDESSQGLIVVLSLYKDTLSQDDIDAYVLQAINMDLNEA